MKRAYVFAPLLVILVAYLGSIFTFEGMSWYVTLVRPVIAPPNGIFAPMWTLLFILIVISLLLFIHHRPASIQFQDTLWLFALNGFLNVFWCVLFFQWHLMGWAIFDAGLLSLTALMLAILIWPFSKLASVLLWPYVLWTAFATLLTYSFWLMN